MTREETIKILNDEEIASLVGKFHGGKEALDLAISALRPVGREQVKKAEWIWSTGDVYICSSCGEKTHVDECMGTPIYNFCPFCMAPMTDEAMDILLGRLEALEDGKDN